MFTFVMLFAGVLLTRIGILIVLVVSAVVVPIVKIRKRRYRARLEAQNRSADAYFRYLEAYRRNNR